VNPHPGPVGIELGQSAKIKGISFRRFKKTYASYFFSVFR